MQAEHLLTDDEELSGFTRRRDSAIQRSQDSGALTDWSGSRGSPTRDSCDSLERELEPAKYVTVLSVNGGLDLPRDPSDYVTVLSIGRAATEDDVEGSSVCLSLAGFIEEVVRIARKPGQKLGFGLKFDGGVEPETLVRRLFIQCCAEASPASSVRCSWGKLVEADEIIEIDGADIRNRLGRVQVVHKLTDGQEVLTLKIRHYWDDRQRHEIMQQLNTVGTSQRAETKSAKKNPAVRHERAVDVPDELLHQLNHSRSRSVEPHPRNDDLPPPVPPPRRRKSKADKLPVARSLSSDQVLAQRSIVNIPSKPPRKGLQQSLSFIDRSSETPPPPSTFPRTTFTPQPAQIYINLIAEEDKRNEICAEPESDTSVSTVVDVSSRISSPFCETIEIQEFREQPKKELAANEMEIGNDSALAVLIQPPETFLDQEPSSISPNSDGQQDASSDSGASSGGSELQLTESDEELRFFQQMESALESGEDCDAILWPLPEAPPACSEEEKAPIDGTEQLQECQEVPTVVKQEAGHVGEAVAATAEKVEHSKKASRLKSRIPQAVSSSRLNAAAQPAKSPVAGVNSRAGRALANNKTTSGSAAVKSVKSPAIRNNAPANRVAAAASRSASSNSSSQQQAKPATGNSSKPLPATGPSAPNMLKSVKPGLSSGGAQQSSSSSSPLSKIPRPAQGKSGPTAQLARPALRHPSSSIQQQQQRTGVKAAGAQHQAKSPSRPHLTHITPPTTKVS